MTNIEKIISNAGLSHQEVSSRTGRKGNWFNDAFNNNEDIQISSLSKVLAVVNSHAKINKYLITDIFDEKVLRISRVMSSLADENPKSINDFIISEINLFIDLVGDWGSLNSKNKLTDIERLYFDELQRLVKHLAEKEGE